MHVVARSYRVQLLELARLPSFAVPSFALPAIAFVLFGLPQVHGDAARANYLVTSFAAFAVLGIVMFQFGVGIAVDRDSPWERLLRTVPWSPAARLVARLAVALTFAAASAVPVMVIGALATPLSVGLLQSLRIAVAIGLGIVPLGLLGFALGYLLSPKGALPVTNLLYLPLAYVGGLFGPADALPRAVARMRPWVPTGQWNDIVQQFGLSGSVPVHELAGLLAWGVVFAFATALGYRRDETTNYA